MRIVCWFCLGSVLLILGCQSTQRYDPPAAASRDESVRKPCDRPVLDVLQETAEREIAALGIEAAVRRDRDESLEIDYQLREFQVHWLNKRSQWSEDTRPERGPDMGGFRIVLMLSPGGYIGQLKRPNCSLDNPSLGDYLRGWSPYYDRYASQIELTPIDRSIQVNIECGLSCDREAVERIRQALLRACDKCGWLVAR